MRYERDPRMEQENSMVIEALGKAGIDVTSVYDLVNSKKPYPKAVPILLDMLPKVHNDRIKEGVARALGVKEARPIAARPLLREFVSLTPKTTSQEHTKWAIGNALAAVADDSVFEEISSVFDEKHHGWTRSALALALGNMKEHRDQAVRQLIGSLKDPDVATEALIALGNLRVKDARPHIEPFLHHHDSWVRQQAKRALAKIDKAS